MSDAVLSKDGLPQASPRGVGFGEAAMMCLIASVISFGAAIGVSTVLDRQQTAEIARDAPRFARIDTQRLLGAFIAQQASRGLEGEALETATINWTRAYNDVVQRLHEQGGYVVLDAKSVAAGGVDLTGVVEDALR